MCQSWDTHRHTHTAIYICTYIYICLSSHHHPFPLAFSSYYLLPWKKKIFFSFLFILYLGGEREGTHAQKNNKPKQTKKNRIYLYHNRFPTTPTHQKKKQFLIYIYIYLYTRVAVSIKFLFSYILFIIHGAFFSTTNFFNYIYIYIKCSITIHTTI